MTMAALTRASGHDGRVQVRLGTAHDRAVIYRLRHLVYAQELRQHQENVHGALTDPLDAFNLYIVAAVGGEVAGFISITPPGHVYSIDKYLGRHELPFPCDDQLYEVRLLTVLPTYRQSTLGAELAGLLIYAAFRWIESQGGGRVVAIGRREVQGLYRKVGLRPLGRQIQSGQVQYELMSATMAELRQTLPRYEPLVRFVEPNVDWRLAVPYYPDGACFHGGASFRAIGDEFEKLERAPAVINADVLDAWFAPAPVVLAALRENLTWLVSTSPPADGAGLVRTIARVRKLAPEAVLPGAGSSDLIFRALRHWLTPAARVLLLDPTYGEYAHVCERVIGCHVVRLPLIRQVGYELTPDVLEASVAAGDYDLVVLVNPNNPTGRHLSRDSLEMILRRVPSRTRVWLDEAYSDYVGADQSLESFAARSANVVVCKSLSKAYALSGLRVGYLCGPPALMEELRRLTPPWIVSLPAQVAAVAALQASDYYAKCYAATHALRHQLEEGLRTIDHRLEVVPGTANFALCHLPADGPDAATVVSHCQARGLFLRDAGGVNSILGRHAVRIAVKAAEVQAKLLEVLATVVRDGA